MSDCQKDDERLDPNFKLSKQITTPTYCPTFFQGEKSFSA